MTSKARTLIINAGGEVLEGTPDDVRAAALAECERVARQHGWTQEAWEATEADMEYVQAQVVLAEERAQEHGDCGYCGMPLKARHEDGVNVEPTPDDDDDESWEALAVAHGEDCEWVTTRAHRV